MNINDKFPGSIADGEFVEPETAKDVLPILYHHPAELWPLLGDPRVGMNQGKNQAGLL